MIFHVLPAVFVYVFDRQVKSAPQNSNPLSVLRHIFFGPPKRPTAATTATASAASASSAPAPASTSHAHSSSNASDLASSLNGTGRVSSAPPKLPQFAASSPLVSPSALDLDEAVNADPIVRRLLRKLRPARAAHHHHRHRTPVAPTSTPVSPEALPEALEAALAFAAPASSSASSSSLADHAGPSGGREGAALFALKRWLTQALDDVRATRRSIWHSLWRRFAPRAYHRHASGGGGSSFSGFGFGFMESGFGSGSGATDDGRVRAADLFATRMQPSSPSSSSSSSSSSSYRDPADDRVDTAPDDTVGIAPVLLIDGISDPIRAWDAQEVRAHTHASGCFIWAMTH
jgi:hypothetical protein